MASRGIDVATFEVLRKAGNAEYAWDGVAFIGKQSSGLPGMIERRLFNKLPVKDKPGKFLNHLVEKGSDRSFPVLIAGSCSDVAIVEGNFDGLGLHEINSRDLAKDKQPLIIIAGGKDNVKMFENLDIIAILANASNVESWSDNEVLDIADFDDASLYQEALANKQADTNKAHAKRVVSIRAINPTATIKQCYPPVSAHDLAELNKQIKSTLPKPASKFKF